MKTFPTIAAAMAFALLPLGASAGVVITQEQTANTPSGERKTEQTIMIQGNKQKIVTNKRQMLTDLDKNAMYLIDPNNSTYVQISFPLSGPMARAVANAAGALDFKKGTTTRKVLGYSCTDYMGKGQSMGGEFTVTECFSTEAPGAKEFDAFQRGMADKIKNVSTSTIPQGIPLALDSTVQMNTMKLPQGLPPQEQQRLQQQMAQSKPVTVTTKAIVTKVETKTLPDDTFEIPKGYTQRQLPHMTMRRGPASPGASPGAAASAGAPAAAPSAAAAPNPAPPKP